MKAQRRHELQKNTLVRGLENIPSAGRTYGPRIALVAIFLALIGVWFYNHQRSNQMALEQARGSLADAQGSVQEINQWDSASARADLGRVATARQKAYENALASADSILKNDAVKDPAIRAGALLAEGDANWNLANLPPLPGASTRPALQPEKSTEQLLSAAESAYQQVIDKYSQELVAVATARLSLAAIAENRGQWDQAKSIYAVIVKDDSQPPIIHREAEERQLALAELQLPARLGAPITQPTTFPATAPDSAPAPRPLSRP